MLEILFLEAPPLKTAATQRLSELYPNYVLTSGIKPIHIPRAHFTADVSTASGDSK